MFAQSMLTEDNFAGNLDIAVPADDQGSGVRDFLKLSVACGNARSISTHDLCK